MEDEKEGGAFVWSSEVAPPCFSVSSSSHLLSSSPSSSSEAASHPRDRYAEKGLS